MDAKDIATGEEKFFVTPEKDKIIKAKYDELMK
jgi:hypothetical protein